MKNSRLFLKKTKTFSHGYHPTCPTLNPRWPVTSCRLTPLPNCLIQKRRHFTPERVAIIEAEIDKLLEAGFIEDVAHSAWLANVVLVMKKEKGKWSVCVDYTDLNKACLKDPYPVPRIDLLVD
ncbi:hypothetical protein ACFX1T_024231 [Malus domestica]